MAGPVPGTSLPFEFPPWENSEHGTGSGQPSGCLVMVHISLFRHHSPKVPSVRWTVHFSVNSAQVLGGPVPMLPLPESFLLCPLYVCVSRSVVSTLCDPMDCSPPDSSVQGVFQGKNTGVGWHSLLQGILSTQGLNLCLLHCRQILYKDPRQPKINNNALHNG